MPLPKPRPAESRDDFLSRCMGNSTMVTDFPNNRQRYAVCIGLWDKKKALEITDSNIEK